MKNLLKIGVATLVLGLFIPSKPAQTQTALKDAKSVPAAWFITLKYLELKNKFISSNQEKTQKSAFRSLKLAIEAKDYKKSKKILAMKKIDLNRNIYKQSFLHLAVNKNLPKIANLLIKRRIDINNTSDPLGRTPLGLAVYNGNIEMVRLLLDKGALINKRSYKNTGSTPLLIAVTNRDRSMAEFLISRGADVDKKSRIKINELKGTYLAQYKNIAPLHVAALFGQSDIAELLIKNGADLQAETAEGRTPYDFLRIGQEEVIQEKREGDTDSDFEATEKLLKKE